MKPNFRPAVYAHHQRKDGSFNVKICIFFNGKERRLPTTIYCEKKDLTRSYHIKSQDILNKANTLIAKMHGAIADLTLYDMENKDVDWLVSRIKTKLQAQTFRLDFFAHAERYMEGMNEGTARTYATALNAFARFLKKREIDINDITKRLLLEFVAFCNNEPRMAINRHTGEFIATDGKKRKGLASATYIYKLGAIFKDAKMRYNDEDEDVVLIPRSPFDGLELEFPNAEGEEALPLKVLQMLVSDRTEKAKNGHRYAIDCVVVSFGLMGMNLADMFEAKPPKDGVLTYNRCKTRDRRADGAEMRVPVPDVLLPYLERLGAGTDGKVWLPVMRESSQDRRIVTSRVNRGIRSWCKAHGIEPFTTYALRKSWATMARATGADKSLVDECIGHIGDYRMTDIYATRPWEVMADLNRKVLAMLEW